MAVPEKRSARLKNMKKRKEAIPCRHAKIHPTKETYSLFADITSFPQRKEPSLFADIPIASSIGALPIDKNIPVLDWLDTIHSLGHSRTSLQISEMLAQVLSFRKKVG